MKSEYICQIFYNTDVLGDLLDPKRHNILKFTIGGCTTAVQMRRYMVTSTHVQYCCYCCVCMVNDKAGETRFDSVVIGCIPVGWARV